MKRLAVLTALVAMLASNTAVAQQKNSGRGASSSVNTSADDFSWGIAIGGLVAIGVVVGVVVAGATSSINSH